MAFRFSRGSVAAADIMPPSGQPSPHLPASPQTSKKEVYDDALWRAIDNCFPVLTDRPSTNIVTAFDAFLQSSARLCSLSTVSTTVRLQPFPICHIAILSLRTRPSQSMLMRCWKKFLFLHHQAHEDLLFTGKENDGSLRLCVG